MDMIVNNRLYTKDHTVRQIHSIELTILDTTTNRATGFLALQAMSERQAVERDRHQPDGRLVAIGFSKVTSMQESPEKVMEIEEGALEAGSIHKFADCISEALDFLYPSSDIPEKQKMASVLMNEVLNFMRKSKISIADQVE